jgi:hypothetical protein
MTAVEGPRATGLVARVQNILTKPVTEWDVVAAEPATVSGLYTGYICLLAAIPAVAGVLGSALLGHGFLIGARVGAVGRYALTLASVYVIAFIVDALAPSFGGERSMTQALKLVAYSYTAAWVAGVFLIVPLLGWLVSVAGGFYSLYLLYLGLPKVMKNPADKTMIYLIVTIAAAVIVYIVVGAVVAMVTAMFAIGALATGAAALSTH